MQQSSSNSPHPQSPPSNSPTPNQSSSACALPTPTNRKRKQNSDTFYKELTNTLATLRESRENRAPKHYCDLFCANLAGQLKKLDDESQSEAMMGMQQALHAVAYRSSTRHQRILSGPSFPLASSTSLSTPYPPPFASPATSVYHDMQPPRSNSATSNSQRFDFTDEW